MHFFSSLYIGACFRVKAKVSNLPKLSSIRITCVIDTYSVFQTLHTINQCQGLPNTKFFYKLTNQSCTVEKKKPIKLCPYMTQLYLVIYNIVIPAF